MGREALRRCEWIRGPRHGQAHHPHPRARFSRFTQAPWRSYRLKGQAASSALKSLQDLNWVEFTCATWIYIPESLVKNKQIIFFGSNAMQSA
jgi:hypothetical protein